MRAEPFPARRNRQIGVKQGGKLCDLVSRGSRETGFGHESRAYRPAKRQLSSYSTRDWTTKSVELYDNSVSNQVCTSRHDAFSIRQMPFPPRPPLCPPARASSTPSPAAAASPVSSGSPHKMTTSSPACEARDGNAGAKVRSPQARTKCPGLQNADGDIRCDKFPMMAAYGGGVGWPFLIGLNDPCPTAGFTHIRIA